MLIQQFHLALFQHWGMKTGPGMFQPAKLNNYHISVLQEKSTQRTVKSGDKIFQVGHSWSPTI